MEGPYINTHVHIHPEHILGEILNGMKDMLVSLRGVQTQLIALTAAVNGIMVAVQTGGRIDMATLEQVKAKLDELSAKVATDTQVKASASTLMDGLAEILRNIKNDPAAVEALAAQIDSATTEMESSNAALAAAVERNTPGVV